MHVIWGPKLSKELKIIIKSIKKFEGNKLAVPTLKEINLNMDHKSCLLGKLLGTPGVP